MESFKQNNTVWCRLGNVILMVRRRSSGKQVSISGGEKLIRTSSQLGTVAHSCNDSYLGG
jgi:hypothetical protein